MSNMDLNNKAKGFNTHNNLPDSEDQAIDWQRANKTWWEKNPMRYDFSKKITYKEYSKEFYNEIDTRFYNQVREYMPWSKIPFDNLIDYNLLSNKRVLEIGVGNGSHAQLLSSKARSYTGIDLTEYSVNSTKKRLELFKLNGKILQMDAEKMNFDDNSFDLIWSWGVIHHTSDTNRALTEINRILAPKGKVITMVYYRSPWIYYVRGFLIFGILKGKLFKGKSLPEILQESVDGALARFYSIKEWKLIITKHFNIENIKIYGTKHQLIPFLRDGKFKRFLTSLIPDSVGRFICNRPLVGWFLVSTFNKKELQK